MTVIPLKRLSNTIRREIVRFLGTNDVVLIAGPTTTRPKLLGILADRIALKLAPKSKKPAKTVAERTRSRVKKALKKLSGPRRAKVVEGMRFIDPKSKVMYSAGSEEGRGWLCTGVKKTYLVDVFPAGIILKNRTAFQPARAR